MRQQYALEAKAARKDKLVSLVTSIRFKTRASSLRRVSSRAEQAVPFPLLLEAAEVAEQEARSVLAEMVVLVVPDKAVWVVPRSSVLRPELVAVVAEVQGLPAHR